jgi:pimeloyl-ACP methyl ester carboxylesterase
MPHEPTKPPARARRERLQRWISFVLAALLVVAVTYFGYVGFEGSGQMTGHPSPSRDCRTPAMLGWEYEAVNYDVGGDAALAEEPDPERCRTLGLPAGDEVTASDGTRIAGWWIPSAADIGPAGPTVVLAHGWGSNKSRMLRYVELLRSSHNVVAFDFRHHGQSGGETTTQGLLEQQDLRAVLDWLERSKAPAQIALFGESMGGATAVNVARDDPRVDALILDSTHATLMGAIEARLALAGYPLAQPGAWAILFGGLIRTGLDLSSVDPVLAVDDLGDRPLLILHGSADIAAGPRNAERLQAAAQEGGVDVELHFCDAGHAGLVTACGDEYAGWVHDFLARALKTS